MLMSTIVDGGLYRESTFMLQGLFSPELIANRNRFVLTVGAIMVGVACLSMAMGVLAARCSAIATQGFARNMRSTLLGKIESFSFSNIDHISTPQLITRATTDINTLRDTMRQSLVTLYRAPVMVILATVMSFIVSPGLAPLLLICIPLLVVLMVILLKVGQPRFKRMLKMMDGMNQAVRENLVASRVVKAFVRGGYESKRFDKTTDDLRRAQLGPAQVVGGFVKALGLVAPPDEGLHHAAGHQILPDGLVHAVHHLQHPLEAGLAHLQQDHHQHHQQGDADQQQGRKTRGDDEAHDRGQDHHHRGPVQGHQGLAHGVPQGVDVRGGPGDQLGGGDVVDVGEGEALDLPQQSAAHIPGEALGGNGGAAGGQNAHGHGQAGHAHHNGPHRQHEAVAVGDELRGKQPLEHEGALPVQAAVHDGGHEHGDQQLQHHLSDAEYQGGCRPALITAQDRAQVPEKPRFFLCLDKTSPLFLLCRISEVIHGYYIRPRRVSQAEKFRGILSARIHKKRKKCCKRSACSIFLFG